MWGASRAIYCTAYLAISLGCSLASGDISVVIHHPLFTFCGFLSDKSKPVGNQPQIPHFQVIYIYHFFVSRVQHYRSKFRSYRCDQRQQQQLNSCGNSECSDEEEAEVRGVVAYLYLW